MITRYSCAIDGHGLQDIDPTIYITDISEDAPKEQITTTNNALYDGLYYARKLRQSVSVSVSFEVHEYDTARRKAVAERACEWARDGWLTINDRPNQRIYATCTKRPMVTSALKWTDKLTVSFTAYALPYWQEIYPVQARSDGAAFEVNLFPPGNHDSYLEADIQAQGETLNTLSITANDATLSFANLGMSTGQTLSISYDDAHHWMQIRIDGASAMSKRQGASDDDILLRPRVKNTVKITADAMVRATVRVRGLWE